MFFDAVVGGEVGAEVEAGLDEGAGGEVGGALVGGAGCVEEVPGLAEVVVEVFHVFGHAVIDSVLGSTQLRQLCFQPLLCLRRCRGDCLAHHHHHHRLAFALRRRHDGVGM